MKTRETLFTSPRVYKPTLLDRTFPLLITASVVVFLWIVVFFLTRSSRTPTSAAFYIGIVILSVGALLLGGLLYLGTRRVYLLTASEGLFYQSFGYCVYTPWHNIGEVKSVTYGMRDIDNLSLKEETLTDIPLQVAIKERIAVLNTNAALRATKQIQPASIAVGTFADAQRGIYRNRSVDMGSGSHAKLIPVGTFSGWKSGELADEIKRYKVANIYAHMLEKEQRESHT